MEVVLVRSRAADVRADRILAAGDTLLERNLAAVAGRILAGAEAGQTSRTDCTGCSVRLRTVVQVVELVLHMHRAEQVAGLQRCMAACRARLRETDVRVEIIAKT